MLAFAALLEARSAKRGDLEAMARERLRRLGVRVDLDEVLEAEERRASHILITAAKNAAPAERTAAKAKAEALLAQVKAAPDSFSDLAKKNSQDPGSAANGGDLDFFARGAMVKWFEW